MLNVEQEKTKYLCISENHICLGMLAEDKIALRWGTKLSGDGIKF